jgi:hypothetical protein
VIYPPRLVYVSRIGHLQTAYKDGVQSVSVLLLLAIFRSLVGGRLINKYQLSVSISPSVELSRHAKTDVVRLRGKGFFSLYTCEILATVLPSVLIPCSKVDPNKPLQFVEVEAWFLLEVFA